MCTQRSFLDFSKAGNVISVILPQCNGFSHLASCVLNTDSWWRLPPIAYIINIDYLRIQHCVLQKAATAIELKTGMNLNISDFI